MGTLTRICATYRIVDNPGLGDDKVNETYYTLQAQAVWGRNQGSKLYVSLKWIARDSMKKESGDVGERWSAVADLDSGIMVSGSASTRLNHIGRVRLVTPAICHCYGLF